MCKGPFRSYFLSSAFQVRFSPMRYLRARKKRFPALPPPYLDPTTNNVYAREHSNNFAFWTSKDFSPSPINTIRVLCPFSHFWCQTQIFSFFPYFLSFTSHFYATFPLYRTSLLLGHTIQARIPPSPPHFGLTQGKFSLSPPTVFSLYQGTLPIVRIVLLP